MAVQVRNNGAPREKVGILKPLKKWQCISRIIKCVDDGGASDLMDEGRSFASRMRCKSSTPLRIQSGRNAPLQILVIPLCLKSLRSELHVKESLGMWKASLNCEWTDFTAAILPNDTTCSDSKTAFIPRKSVNRVYFTQGYLHFESVNRASTFTIRIKILYSCFEQNIFSLEIGV